VVRWMVSIDVSKSVLRIIQLSVACCVCNCKLSDFCEEHVLNYGYMVYICFIFRSNCHPEILAIMREHYSIPHFLPEDAEHAHMDYIFIGYHQGAVMHVSKILRLMYERKDTYSIFPWHVITCESSG